MTLRRKRPLICILLALLLCGCGEGKKESSPGQESASAEGNSPAGTASEQLAPVRSRTEVMAAMESAWGREAPSSALPLTLGENAADIMASDGDILYIIKNKSVLVCRGGGGTLEVLTALEVGEDWTEENGEDFWGGHEKQPVALCALRGRLAVISECSSYCYTVDEEGGWAFRDHSSCGVDLFDTEEIGNVVPMGFYGQSGSYAGALEKDGTLYVATRRELFAEDFEEEDRDDLPSLFNGQEEKKLSWDCMTLLSGGSSWYTLLSAYSPYNGVRTDSTALIGGGERMIMDDTGLSLLRGDPAEELLCPFGENGLRWSEEGSRELSAEALTDAAQRGEDWRSVTKLPEGAEWSCPWDGERTFELYRTDTGLRAVLSGNGKSVAELPLGYDFQAAAEEAKSIYTDAASGTLVLPAEDSWAVWRLEDGGFAYVRSLFSPDYSENRRCFLWGGSLYAADTARVFALDPETLDVQGEWTL